MDEFLERFGRQAAARPKHPAAVAAEQAFTYAELAAAADAAAWALKAQGLKRGDLLGYLGLSMPWRVVTLIAGLKAGVTVVVLNPRDPVAALRDLAGHAGLVALALGPGVPSGIVEEIGLPAFEVEEAAAARGRAFPAVAAGPDEIAYVLYTSGSTGRPKGVPVRRMAAARQIENEAMCCDYGPDERVGLFGQVWMPMTFCTLRAGATLECFDFPGRGVAEMADFICARRLTLLEFYPAMLRALSELDAPPFPDVRQVYLAGEALTKADVELFERLCPPDARLINVYGSSEYVGMTCYRHRHGDPVGVATLPAGLPLEPDRLRLLDAGGRDVPIGEIGEVVMRSEFTPKAYHNDPERSAKTFRPTPGAPDKVDYHTGDYAFLDSAGMLHTVGRKDDQIKIRGYTLRPSDIEQELLAVPGVKRCVVVGLAGPRGIQRLACHYEADGVPGPTPDMLKAYLAARMPAYMTPGHFVRHDRLPRTATGKILRRGLPNPLASLSGRGAVPPEGPAESALAAIWGDILGHGDFGRDDDFFDIGGDSLQAMEMLLEAEKRFGVRAPFETLILDGATIRSVAERLSAAGPAAPAAMNRGGPAPPLFATHVVGGHLSDYLALAHAFDGVRPVLALRPRGLDGRSPPDTEVAAAAGHLAEIIGGPADAGRILMGYSAGGLFAFETARRLAGNGGRPPVLLLLDCPCPWLASFGGLRQAWRAARRGRPTEGLARLFGGLAPAPAGVDAAHQRALAAYRPAPLALPRALLVRAENGLVAEADVSEWRRLIGAGLEVMAAPGDHLGLLRPPHAGALAQRLHAWLKAGEATG